MADSKALTGLKALIAKKQAEQQEVAKPQEQPKQQPSFKQLADIIRRQQEAKHSQGDKEKAHALSIAKQILNTRPEVILENQEQKHATKAEIVNAPVIGLKALIARSKAADEKQFTDTAAGETAIATISTGEIEYDDSQLAALDGLLANKFACLIGPAGSGKSTVVDELIRRLDNEIGTVKYETKNDRGEYETKYKPSLWIGSFTGRAVEVLRSKIDPKWRSVCGTIHGETCLAYQPEFYEDLDVETGRMKSKMRFVPSFNENNKLPYTIFIIDEASMVAVDLWNTLFAAMVHNNVRVYFVGDINQLPPVYGRSILGYAMTKWPTFELTKIHRQAANNPIIANAHRILRGEVPVRVKDKFDMLSLENKGSLGSQQYMLSVIKKLHRNGSFNEIKDGFIVPQNKGPIGKDQFNELLVPYFNPEQGLDNKRHLIKTGIAMVAFAKGDKVMLLANDKENGLTNGQVGVITNIAFNGAYKNNGEVSITHADLSRMHNTEVDEDNFELKMEDTQEISTDVRKEEKEINQRQASHITTVRFGEFDPELLDELNKLITLSVMNRLDSSMVAKFAAKMLEEEKLDIADLSGVMLAISNRIYRIRQELNKTSREVSFSTAGEYRNITHAYCFTCHKSQGGEYPTVAILIHSANFALLSREWFYTAVTRARNRVVLVYNERGLMQCLQVQRIKGKTLKDKIKSFLEVSEKDAGRDGAIVPNLPEPKEWKE